jgi:putative phosphoribosyl transferase
MRFRDREEAGVRLGKALAARTFDRPIVIGLPRGGVPVAAEVAAALDAPLDVWVVRKLGVPFQPELGMGAIAEGPSLVLDRGMVEMLGITNAQVMAVVRREADEVRQRVSLFRGDRPAPDVRGRTVILVDDGIATGGTARAAVRALRKRGAGRIVLAVPVGAWQALETLRRDADEVVCLYVPTDLHAIGLWYERFGQVPNEDVVAILERTRADVTREVWGPSSPARARRSRAPGAAPSSSGRGRP